MGDSKKVRIYFVKLGKLFYAGGQSAAMNKNKILTYHFVSYKEAATPFVFKDVAQEIADQVGGQLGFDDYTQEDLETLSFIKEFHEEKMVLPIAKKLLPSNLLI